MSFSGIKGKNDKFEDGQLQEACNRNLGLFSRVEQVYYIWVDFIIYRSDSQQHTRIKFSSYNLMGLNKIKPEQSLFAGLD